MVIHRARKSRSPVPLLLALPLSFLLGISTGCSGPPPGVKATSASEPPPEQFVHLHWESGTDALVSKIGESTVTAELPPNFPILVKWEVEKSFMRFYEGLPVSLTSASGPDVHTVTFTMDEDQRAKCGEKGNRSFGCSADDCGNQRLSDNSFVFLHQFHQSMSSLERWLPMSLDDSPHTRAEDLGEAIGRAAAHELGHSLGLVLVGCQALKGCSGNHNGDEAGEPVGARICTGRGMHLMDKGRITSKHWRLAQATEHRGPRTPSTIRSTNRQYVEALFEE